MVFDKIVRFCIVLRLWEGFGQIYKVLRVLYGFATIEFLTYL